MKKILSYILVFVFVVTLMPMGIFSFEVSAETEGYYTYKIVDNKATITSVSSNISGDIVIPSYLGGYPVTCIGKNAFFYKSKIGSVVIPNTVTTIESSAFDSCSITSVEIPNSVTSFGTRVFYSCYSLTSITIPNSISTLSHSLFYQCKNLKSIVLPRSVTTIDLYAFYGCGSLTDVWYEGTEQQKNAIDVTYSYYNSGLENATWHYNSCPSNGTHKYNNNCDTDCNLCGAIRSITHTYQYNSWIVTLEPTCTNNGSRYRNCSVCGYVYTETMSALGHDKTTHTAQKPTCTKIGWDEYVTCSRCDYTTYVEISETGHTTSDWIIDTNSTCTASGSKHKECTVCQEILSTESIDSLGHDEIIHNAQAPTCTEIGWDEYVTCSRCDYTTYVEISALGHDEITHEAKAPTCTEIGWNEYVTCSRCDYTTYEEISATGIHNYVGVVTDPTCTEQGYTTYTCSMCGGSYVDDYVDAAGHTYDDDFDATCNNCDFIREAKKHGDINNDGVLNNRDAALLMQYINGWNVEIDVDAADINHDGKINNKDYVILVRRINGWEQ